MGLGDLPNIINWPPTQTGWANEGPSQFRVELLHTARRPFKDLPLLSSSLPFHVLGHYFTITSPDRYPAQISWQLFFSRITEPIENIGAGGGSRTRIGQRPAGF